MSTQKMPDKELDAMFQKALEERPVVFDERAWLLMQKKMRNARFKKWATRASFVLLGIALVSLIWILQPSKDDRPQTADRNKNQINSPQLNLDSVKNSQNTDNQINSLRSTVDSPQLNSNLSSVKNSQNTDNQINSLRSTVDSPQLNLDSVKNSQNTDNQINSLRSTVDSPQLNLDSVKNSQNTDNQINSPRSTVDSPQLNLDSVKNSQNTDNQINSLRSTVDSPQLNSNLSSVKNSENANNQLIKKSNPENPVILSENNRKINSDSNSIKNSENAVILSENKNKLLIINELTKKEISQTEAHFPKALADSLPENTKQRSRLSVRKNWSLSLFVSPDWSLAGKSKGLKIGENIGFLTEYEFLPRLSATIGVIYSHKVYDAAADAYKPYDGIWGYIPKPDNIAAQCNILEIPINLRYYFLNQSRNRLFISSGISSYWMLSERYQYEYNDPRKPPRFKEIDNENTHYFNVLNASFGFERVIHQRFSVQIEPFIKIPLAEIGFGKVRLLSTGAFLSLKYKL